MRVLHLFAGAGGGVLADAILGHRCVGYVEWEGFPQAVLKARQADGLLDVAPVFGDVREFVRSGAAREYRGIADVVSGDFPCQPFSVAGKRAGSADERNMWPAFAEVVREVRPRFVFAENVPGLASWDGGAYFGRVVGALAALGYGVRWTVLGADDAGAPHRRKRLWILADAGGGEPGSGSEQLQGREPSDGQSSLVLPLASGGGGEAQTGNDSAADAERAERRQDDDPRGRVGARSNGQGKAAGRLGECGAVLADADQAGQQQHGGTEPVQPKLASAECGGWWSLDPADIPDAELWRCRPACLECLPDGGGTKPPSAVCDNGEGGRSVESLLGRMADVLADQLDFARTAFGGRIPRVASGVPNRVGRLRALGNGQVPMTAAMVWVLLGGPVRGRV